MSTVFLIDQNTGIIRRELIAYASYREEGLLTVKPRNEAEAELWRQFSKNNEKIAALTAEVEKLARQVQKKEAMEKEAARIVDQMLCELANSPHEKYCPGRLREIQAEWEQAAGTLSAGNASQAVAAQAQQTLYRCRTLKREIASAQLKESEGQQRTEESLKRISEKLTAMETVCLEIQTDNGLETVDAPTDLLTSHGLRALQSRLDELIRRALEGGGVRQEELDALEQDTDQLPGEAREIYLTHTIRMEEAEAVRKRLEQSGWKVDASMGDLVSDDVVFYLENQLRERAAITFPLIGKIKIDSPLSWNAGGRRALQMLIMRALKDYGVPGLHGHCTDGKDPDIREEDMADQVMPAPPAPMPTPAASWTLEKRRMEAGNR